MPLDWQRRIASIGERNRRGYLSYESLWQVNPENPLAEWYIWRLLKIIPRIDSKLYVNCYIDLGTGSKGTLCRHTYLACLQRRFPEVGVKLKIKV